ncbi:MAG: hypothetical protein VW270_19475 [Candidatus Poseidoniales archaeon]
MNKEQLIETLQSNYNDKAPIEVNDKHWTLADLFARQWLNNGWDGFGMVNVKQMYNLLCENKQLLIDNNMINEVAWNNSGYPLWDGYDFDFHYKGDEEE